ncbi:MAG: DMT family transporter [Anaerolineae bacterium]|nr:DMT family transporter [Anaerolineae bacterium]
MPRTLSDDNKGLIAALLSPLFLGLAPIFGKIALVGGAEPFTVAAFRTGLVALLLWVVYLLVWRRFIYIYPAGLIACLTVGATNGIGSLFYYSGLDLLDASVAQLLNANYLLFVVILTRLDGSRIGWRTVLRVLVALLGTLLITGGLAGQAEWLGIGLMLGNALLFAGTVVMSQRVLYEMPAQRHALHHDRDGGGGHPGAPDAGPELGAPGRGCGRRHFALALSTAISRLLLFAGVKGIGGIKTTLLAILEGAVAVSLAFLLLEERFSPVEWAGVAVLVASLFIRVETPAPNSGTAVGLAMPNIADLRYQQLAFTRAFLKKSSDPILTQEMHALGNIFGVDDKISTDELESLRKMLGEEAQRRLMDRKP